MNTQGKLIEYVDAASDLAECVAKEIEAGVSYSNTTIETLNRFVKAAYALKDAIDIIKEKQIKLN